MCVLRYIFRRYISGHQLVVYTTTTTTTKMKRAMCKPSAQTQSNSPCACTPPGVNNYNRSVVAACGGWGRKAEGKKSTTSQVMCVWSKEMPAATSHRPILPSPCSNFLSASLSHILLPLIPFLLTLHCRKPPPHTILTHPLSHFHFLQPHPQTFISSFPLLATTQHTQ
jgi:hypothetical protein